MNAYEILECDQNASHEELKNSYHRLLLLHHPDKTYQVDNQATQCIDNFLKLQSAYKILSDKEQRLAYDSLLKQINLKRQANNIQINEFEQNDNFFMLNKDFELIGAEFYSRKCRCGSAYKIFTKDLNSILASSSQHENSAQLAESLVVYVECDTCSLAVNVLII